MTGKRAPTRWAIVFSGRTGKYWIELHPQGTFTYREAQEEIKRRKETNS